MGIALAGLGKRVSEKTGDSVAKTQAPNSVTEVMKRGSEKLLTTQAEEKVEKAAKKAAKKVKEAVFVLWKRRLFWSKAMARSAFVKSMGNGKGWFIWKKSR